ncbi:hypothetical protein A0K93_03765 [Corynebacterium sp. BCW_4722]|nr:hypothetical protein A0K93_03765 [Corynebacterium sp. BCW_4722]
MKLLKRIAAAVLTAGLAASAGAGVAQADLRPVVNQGDRVYTLTSFSRGACTVGYVDKHRNRAIFSGHCTLYPGQKVTDVHGRYIGNVASLAVSPGPKVQNDYAYIQLTVGRAGENKFSGDAMVAPHAVRPGEKVCTVGATTQRVMCAPLHSVRGHKIVVNGLTATRKGDSGGPMWIPGRGLVAVNSGQVGDKELGSYPAYYFGPETLLPFKLL